MTPYYSHAGITIYHGDCVEIVPQLKRFDLLLTDPPYGLKMSSQLWTYQRKKIEPSNWDDSPADIACVRQAQSHCDRQIIWGGNYFPLPPTRCILSWFKPDAPPSMGNVEYAWTNLDQNSRQISQSISATNAERLGHPTQKPMRVFAWCLNQAGSGVATVLDPWMGSGTTLRICKDAGKQCVGIQREERYCEISAKRLAQECFAI